MKKASACTACAAAILGLTFATGAQAQEPVIYDWSGPYLGVKLGGGFGDGRITSVNGPTSGDFNIDGFVGGLMSGYNFQVDSIVFGIDSDLSFADIDGRGQIVTPMANLPLPARVEVDFFSTTRARVGYAFDRFLPYVTGGLATGWVDGRVAPNNVRGEFHYGYAVGGGLEWAFMDGWHGRVEYLYADLGQNYHSSGFRIDVKDMHIVRAGISMKTGWILDSILGGM